MPYTNQKILAEVQRSSVLFGVCVKLFDFSQGECENGEFSQWICVSPIQLYTAECHLLPCPCDIMVESLEERVFVGMKILEDAGSTG